MRISLESSSPLARRRVRLRSSVQLIATSGRDQPINRIEPLGLCTITTAFPRAGTLFLTVSSSSPGALAARGVGPGFGARAGFGAAAGAGVVVE
jgi:hypothetical protein